MSILFSLIGAIMTILVVGLVGVWAARHIRYDDTDERQRARNVAYRSALMSEAKEKEMGEDALLRALGRSGYDR